MRLSLDIGEQIKQVLYSNPQGLSSKKIALALDTTRRTVNSYIYHHKDQFINRGENVPIWTVRNSREASDPVMLKLQNRDGARCFTHEEFDAIADWKRGHAFANNTKYTTASGNTIECDSKSEIALLQYLENNKLVIDLGGQALCINYDSAFRHGLEYYPDIVAYTIDHHIAIFEVKPVASMDKHKNIEKYKALAKYCKERGYMYTMIDPKAHYSTVEEVRDMQVSELLEDAFKAWLEIPKPYKCLDNDAVDKWYEQLGNGYTKGQFRLQVHSLVMKNNCYNFFAYGFKVYNRPVRLDSEYNVVEYI